MDTFSKGDTVSREPKPTAAGDVVIGGLRCTACKSLFRPDKNQANEVCQRCRYYALIRERFREGNDKRVLR